MPVHQLGQLAGYQQFTDWSNNTWQIRNLTQGKPQKGANLYTSTEYTANPQLSMQGFPTLHFTQLFQPNRKALLILQKLNPQLI